MSVYLRHIALRQAVMREVSKSVRLPALALALLTVSGCTWFQSDVKRGYAQSGPWDGGVVYTTADIRMVSEHRHPVTNQIVTCTEPTADVAKALTTVAQLNLKGGTGNASGEAGVGGGSGEAVAELAGRSTALLALRDGLFRACEAYSNGAIGSDAYGLVLSRYGQLMTTLFLGEDIQGAARAPAPGVPSPTAPTINLQLSPPSTGSSSPADPKTPANGKKVPTSLQTLTPIEFLKVAQTVPAGQGATDTAGADGTPAAAVTPPPAKPVKPVKPVKPAPPPPPAPTDGSNTPPAGNKTPSDPGADLVQLNGQYFGLDQNLTGQLVVACVNEYDPTRLRRRPGTDGDGSSVNDPAGQNAWLRKMCDSIKSLDAVQTLQKNSVTPPPPEKTPTPPAPAPAPKKSGDVQSGA